MKKATPKTQAKAQLPITRKTKPGKSNKGGKQGY